MDHIHTAFSHLVDSRSFSSFAPLFPRFAAAFVAEGVPVPNLVGFVDGKLWETARPVRGQQMYYSGHKRCHGVKIQGLVFPNGIQPWPFGPVHGSRHDSFMLRQSGLMHILRLCCGVGQTYCLFGDSAYPQSAYLYRIYRGVLAPWQTAFNQSMSRYRVSVEWGFGKISKLWPWLDVAKSQLLLRRDYGKYLQVGNILTNMHTCLYGSIVNSKFGLSPPALHVYMAGGPYP